MHRINDDPVELSLSINLFRLLLNVDPFDFICNFPVIFLYNI